MLKKYSRFLFIAFLIIYLEILTKIFISKSTIGILYTLLFSLPLIGLFYLLTNIMKEKGNKIITFIITILLCIYSGFQTIFYRLFSNIFSFNSISLAGNAIDFRDIAIDAIYKNIGIVITYILPIILLIILRNKIDWTRQNKKPLLIISIITLIIYILSLLSINLDKKETYSAYNLYYNINSEIKMVEKFGLFTYTKIDLKRVIFGFDEKIITNNSTLEEPKQEEEETETKVTYNQIEIDFDDLINNESNDTIKEVLSTLKNTSPTNKNEYTGMFKGKNLIFILAEGFNMIAVDKELTPTLYKLTTEGFVFNNFYSPVFFSTTGGEFQATTGLIATQEALSNWKKVTPNIRFALGNSFTNIGYRAFSYHDWTYTYYSRQKTMPTLGFKDYMGCGNGMENLMSCKWLPSDIDMMNETLPLYKDNKKFVTYYVSVSGHAPYVYNSNGNSIALKNTDLVKDLPYSNNVKAYLATQIEFDRALESLIKGLKEAKILDNTVISFVGDHYPYTLTVDEVNELSTYNRDETVEINHSNFVIWNSKMKKPITVDKVGSQIDVLPTLLNLFGVEYDSRLIVGKDILSDEPGIAIFSNRSWVSDYGTYNRGKFTLKEGKELEQTEEYVRRMNNLVSTKFTLGNQITKYNLYDYILK